MFGECGLKRERGITLIALVVTIIVLLILAAVTIATLTGDNGILTQAQKAKIKTEEAEEDEQKKLAQLAAAMNKENHDYKDKNGDTAVIPKRFAVIEYKGFNTVEDGLVVTDEEGNEFVWIPCTKPEYIAAWTDASTKIGNGYSQSNYTDKTWYNTEDEYTKSLDERLASVETNGGFYVARYEAGVPKNASFYANTDGGINSQDKGRNGNTVINLKPVSKKGEPAWNWISQINAKKVSSNMVEGKSSLIDRNAWYVICNKMEEKGKNLTDSKQWGNYYNNTTTNYEGISTLYSVHTYDDGWHYNGQYSKGTVVGAPKGSGNNKLELATGASEDFKAYNIYDFAGNMWEWNAETTTKDGLSGYAVLRGGSFANVGNSNPVVYSNGSYTVSSYYFGFGFRVALYM